MPMPRTQFKDADIEERERRHFDRPPTPEDGLVAKIMNVIRRTNITVSPPAHNKPIIWSDPIDLSARVTVPAAVGAYQTVIQYQAPPGRWARIDGYGVQVLDAAYTYNGSLLWRIVKNGVEEVGPGLSNWAEQRGSLVNMRPIYIRVEEDDVITFQVRRAVAAGAPQDVDMGLTGWQWPLRMNYEGTGAVVTSF